MLVMTCFVDSNAVLAHVLYSISRAAPVQSNSVFGIVAHAKDCVCAGLGVQWDPGFPAESPA